MSQEMKDIVIVEKPELEFEAKDGSKVRILSEEDEKYLEEKYDDLIDFMRDNHSQDYSEIEKNVMYAELQEKWNDVSGKNGGKLNEVSFNLVLHREEFQYILTLLRDKMEYDVDTVFYALELESLMSELISSEKYESDEDAKAFTLTPVDLHYLYHILSKHTVRGLNKGARSFAIIIQRIALSSGVFNYYKESFSNIAVAIQVWIASLDKGVTIPEDNKSYQLIWGDMENRPVFIAEKKEKEDKKGGKKELSTEKN